MWETLNNSLRRSICGFWRSAALQMLTIAPLRLHFAAHPKPQRQLAARIVQRFPREDLK